MLLLALTTFPNEAEARRLADLLVAEKLVACVNLIPGISSHFIWQGRHDHAEEVLGLMKTTTEAWPALEQRLAALHSYEVPELLALPIAHAGQAYADWVRQQVAISAASPQ